MVTPKFRFNTIEETATTGKFALEPLEIGFGHTLGTALRRVLYTSLSGSAITMVKIDGVRHQFSTLSGMSQDIVDLILNIKQIRIKSDSDKPITMTLSAKGPGEVKASEIEVSDGAKIANPDLVLAMLGKDAKLNVEFTVEKGLGYSPAEDRKTDTLGVIPVDAKFSPVIKVNYNVMSTRVGRVTNFDKLVLDVTTDGTVSPTQAVKDAASVLVGFFGRVVTPVVEEMDESGETVSGNQDILRLTVEELDLPTRIANALRKGGFETVSDLVRTPRKEIARVKNLGSKSVKVIEAALREKGVELTD